MTSPGDFENPNIEEQHDILYACFQNIFFFKDWLHQSEGISNRALNSFINPNLGRKLCRDIANGTKHFTLTQASADRYFTIICEYEHFHKVIGLAPNRIIILAGGHKFELKELVHQCIQLW